MLQYRTLHSGSGAQRCHIAEILKRLLLLIRLFSVLDTTIYIFCRQGTKFAYLLLTLACNFVWLRQHSLNSII
jgi:hypothetical protein